MSHDHDEPPPRLTNKFPTAVIVIIITIVALVIYLLPNLAGVFADGNKLGG